MPLKVECHLNEMVVKWNVTQTERLLKMEYHSKWNVAKNGMSFKREFH